MTTMTQGKGTTTGPVRPVADINEVVIEKFITKRDLSRRLGKSLRTIDSWMQRGLLPYYKIGHTVSFRWSEVQTRLARYRMAGEE